MQTTTITSPISFATTPIECYVDNGEKNIGFGTGFFYRYGNEPYLITNWHVITGRHPETKEFLSNENKIEPTRIKIWLHPLQINKKGVFREKENTCSHDIELHDNEHLPRWAESNNLLENENKIDIAILPMKEMEKLFTNKDYNKIFCINDYDNFVDIKYRIGQSINIIGYPGGLRGEFNTPLWKQGIIASEPYIDDKYFYIDANTFDGMSGSPVVFVHNGLFHSNGILSGNSTIGMHECFAGIYSSRPKGIDGKEKGIGVVWKKHLIDQIINQSFCDHSSECKSLNQSVA